MLPKENRLKKRSAFAATYRTGKSFHIGGITVFIGKEKNNDIPTKFGFVVSKKIHKRAVKRNKIKRLMRESCRQFIKEYTYNKYMSLVFVASSKILDKDFIYVKSTINKLLEQL